mmetsp:Transcript_77216/g.203249  ORF Transcript_77216/g.203249 Transcript_77216/m.203249 type:complete len:723 (+) Transcript_77216:58-2226(+)
MPWSFGIRSLGRFPFGPPSESDAVIVDRYLRESSTRSFKYEVFYVTLVFCLEMVHIALWLDMVVIIPLLLRAALVLYRWFRGHIQTQNRVLEISAAVLDATIFTIAAELSVGSHMSQSGVVFAQFITNILLAYMVLFVFPVKRSLLVTPLCFVAYSCETLRNSGCLSDDCDRANFANVIFGIFLMGSGLTLNIVTKMVMEHARWKLYVMIEESKREVLTEKVLRCQAEFKISPMPRGVSADNCVTDLERGIHVLNPTGKTTQGIVVRRVRPLIKSKSTDAVPALDSGDGWPAAAVGVSADVSASRKIQDFPVTDWQKDLAKKQIQAEDFGAQSAPSVCMMPIPEGKINAKTEGTCVDGDCLPPDALVWIEGEAKPRALGEVIPGQKILCYDRLGGHMKHAVVREISQESGVNDWTEVQLEDGTVLNMTADHPVRPTSDVSGEGPFKGARAAIGAASLQPGVDHLFVLKVVPVAVKQVTTKSVDSSRVYVTVQQPERHSLFVANKGGPPGTTAGIAVESSDAYRRDALNLPVRNTFLHFPDDSSDVQAHPASAPASLHGRSLAGSSVHGISLPGTMTDNDSIGESPYSPTISMASMASDRDALVVLGGPLAPDWDSDVVIGAKPVGLASMMSLKDFRGIKASGWRSIGSVGHSADECNACLFENRRQHFDFKPCYKGVLCERCHEDHDVYKKWKGRRLQQQKVLPSADDSPTPNSGNTSGQEN